MKRIFTLMVAALAIMAPAIVPADTATPGSEEIAAVLGKFVTTNQKRGGVVVVASNGVIRAVDYAGYEDAAQRRPVDQHTRFRIGSCTKTFTAVAILQLVDKGRLKLDDKAFDLLASNGVKPFMVPGASLDERIKKITIRQLLNHTAGWDRDQPWYEGRKEDPVNWEEKISREMKVAVPIGPTNFVSYTMGLPLQNDPGVKFAYSNVGYDWLALIVAKVSGLSYGDYIAKYILKPLAISPDEVCLTSVQDSSDSPHNVMQHDETYLGVCRLESHPGSGGLESSAPGLMKFLLVLFSDYGRNTLLSNRAIDEMVRVPPAPYNNRSNSVYYGFGLNANNVAPGLTNYWHGGLLAGLSEANWTFTHRQCLCITLIEGGTERKGNFGSGLVDPVGHLMDRTWDSALDYTEQFFGKRRVSVAKGN